MWGAWRSKTKTANGLFAVFRLLRHGSVADHAIGAGLGTKA
jgi:hypothetical protein